MDIPCFIHSSAEEHLGCFHVLGITQNAAKNICVQVLCGCVFISLGNLGVEFLDHMVTLFNF